ncbi:hypothetical protein ACIQMR_14505 [Streptomyces sp. NPDC091376]|uniref:hypothetical protein n=1 Tax=Streptomyces sp. NPDC091376 TaxID=3365994 RepID=UPI0037FB4723
MQRRTVRRRLLLPALALALNLVMANPAEAAVIWNGDPDNSAVTAAFGAVLCDEGNYIYP